MADAHKIDITLSWQNGKEFKMTQKEDDDAKIVIVSVEENGNIGAIWAEVTAICTKEFARNLKLIGDQMVV